MPTSPPVTFTTFVISLAHSALEHLGPEQSGVKSTDVELGRHTLELLDLLATKTQGNLDAEEQQLLDTVRGELRSKVG